MVRESIKGAWPQLVHKESHFENSVGLLRGLRYRSAGGFSIEDADWRTRPGTRLINHWSVHAPTISMNAAKGIDELNSMKIVRLHMNKINNIYRYIVFLGIWQPSAKLRDV